MGMCHVRKEKHDVRLSPGVVFRRRETRHVKYALDFLARKQFLKENVLGVGLGG